MSGIGLSACVLELGLRVLGGERLYLYDGSWAEYVSLFFLKRVLVGLS